MYYTNPGIPSVSKPREFDSAMRQGNFFNLVRKHVCHGSVVALLKKDWFLRAAAANDVHVVPEELESAEEIHDGLRTGLIPLPRTLEAQVVLLLRPATAPGLHAVSVLGNEPAVMVTAEGEPMTDDDRPGSVRSCTTLSWSQGNLQPLINLAHDLEEAVGARRVSFEQLPQSATVARALGPSHGAHTDTCRQMLVAYIIAQVGLLGFSAKTATQVMLSWPMPLQVIALHGFAELLLRTDRDPALPHPEQYVTPDTYLEAVGRRTSRWSAEVMVGNSEEGGALAAPEAGAQAGAGGHGAGAAAAPAPPHAMREVAPGWKIPNRTLDRVLSKLLHMVPVTLPVDELQAAFTTVMSSTAQRLRAARLTRATLRRLTDSAWLAVADVKHRGISALMPEADLQAHFDTLLRLGTGSFGSVLAVVPMTVAGYASIAEARQPLAMQVELASGGPSVALPVVMAEKSADIPEGTALSALQQPCLGLVAVAKDPKSDELLWPATDTCWREAIMQAMTSRLVLQCVTPHLCVQYAVVPVRNRSSERAFLHTFTELSGVGLYDAMLVLADESADVQVASINVLVWQVLYTLLAVQRRLGGRHNDLHAGNVLVSSVAPSEDVYVTPAAQLGASDPAAVYGRAWQVPNLGLSARLIDWGHATSTVLFGPDDHLRNTMLAGTDYAEFRVTYSGTDLFYAAAIELRDVMLMLDGLLLLLDDIPAHMSRIAPAALNRIEAAVHKCVALTRAAHDPLVRRGAAALFTPVRLYAARAQCHPDNQTMLEQLVRWWGKTSGFVSTRVTAAQCATGSCYARTPAQPSYLWDLQRPLFGGHGDDGARGVDAEPLDGFETTFFNVEPVPSDGVRAAVQTLRPLDECTPPQFVTEDMRRVSFEPPAARKREYMPLQEPAH